MGKIYNAYRLIIKLILALSLCYLIPTVAATKENSSSDHGVLVSRLATKNVIPVYYYISKNAPIVDITLIFDAGARRDGNHYGLATLTAALLNKGSNQHTADQIAERFSAAGGQFEARVMRDMTILTLRSLSQDKYFKANLHTFIEMLQHPAFSHEAITREKANTLVSIAASFESAADVVDNKFYEVLYQNTPYAHPIIGTKASVTQLTRTDVLNFFNRYYVSRNAKLVIVGNLNTTQLRTIAEKITRALAAGQAAPALANQIPHIKQYNFVIPFPTPQTHLHFGQSGISRDNPDYFALIVGNQILGGSTMTSRLYTEVREKRGLTYGIDSFFLPLKNQGPFVISLQTRQNESRTAEKLTRSVFENFLRTGPTNDELIKIKKYLLGSFPLYFTNNKAISMQITNVAFYDLPLDYFVTYSKKINAVTTTDIKNAFQRHFANRPLIKVEASQASEKK